MSDYPLIITQEISDSLPNTRELLSDIAHAMGDVQNIQVNVPALANIVTNSESEPEDWKMAALAMGAIADTLHQLEDLIGFIQRVVAFREAHP